MVLCVVGHGLSACVVGAVGMGKDTRLYGCSVREPEGHGAQEANQHSYYHLRKHSGGSSGQPLPTATTQVRAGRLNPDGSLSSRSHCWHIRFCRTMVGRHLVQLQHRLIYKVILSGVECASGKTAGGTITFAQPVRRLIREG